MTTAIDLALERLKVEEGFRPTLYRDSENLQTIGYGLCVDRGISEPVAAAALQAQIQEAHGELIAYSWYLGLDPVRQSVCLDIAINEGVGGLLHFPKMIAALAHRDWEGAAGECAVEDPHLEPRYAHLAKILLSGVAA
ncbi:MAG TPA: hypothetical protein VMF03_00205 [Steroidobacteraceae bacterium]|nr:hypothetical protein [Steroidobacteraceae bacterium]